MVHDDDYGCYVEDRGCYYALLHKIRENRRMIFVSLLLTVVVVAVVGGIYNGVTLKEYSNWAVTVGIFFPSVALVFICIYVAFTCGQASVSAILPNVHHLKDGNQSPFYEHATHPERSPAILRVRCQSEHSRMPIDDNMQIFGLEQTTGGRISEETENAPSDWTAKRHFRSLSNSDISRYRNRNTETLDRGYERAGSIAHGEDYRKRVKHARCQSVPERKLFKRCVSDTAYKYRNTRNGENVTAIESNGNARRCGDKLYSAEEHDQSSSECFNEALQQPVANSLTLTQSLERNNETSEDYDKMICYEIVNEVERERNRQDVWVDKYSPKSISYKNWIHHLTKSDAPYFCPTSKIENSREFRRPLYRPRASSTEKEGSGGNKNTFFSDFPKNGKGSNTFILLQQENAISEHLKRKALYYTSAKDRESIRTLPVHVSDSCKYFPEKSKMVQRQLSRNKENIKDYI